VLAIAVRANPTLAAAQVDLVVASAEVEAAHGADDFVLSGDVSWTSQRSQAIAGSPSSRSASTSSSSTSV